MSFTVFLGNLPTWVTADDIKQWLAAEDLVADAVKVIRNHETQESKGFAFVEAPTADEMQASQPELSDELRLVILEQRAGRPRLDAWRNFAERVDLEVVRTLVSSIVQADQFGTSIAKTLRVYADGLRTRRRQQVEEMAAKTAVKLVFPLVFFIFPALFVVALGPSILAIQDSFEKYFK